MNPEPRHILLLLDSGQITLTEAEHLLDSAARRVYFCRLRHWIGNRLGYAIAVAVFIGMLIQPAVLLAAQAAFAVVAGSQALHLFFNRLLEAML